MIRPIDKSLTYPIRQAAMYPDKPLSHVMMDIDDDGDHFAYYFDDQLVSVISLFRTGQAIQFRKFATLPAQQGHGYGSKLLTWVFEYAKSQGVERVWCNARLDKVEYYKKFGLLETPETFVRGDLTYVIMSN